MSPALRFWGSAAAASIVFTALVPLLVAASPADDPRRVWLLTVFVAGVMLALFGIAALISGQRSVGMRDILDAGGVRQALERAERREAGSPAYTHNAAVWCVVTGALLMASYFALWMALR